MKNSHPVTSGRWWLVGLGLAAASLALDLALPLGVAAGMPYVVLVLAAQWSSNRRDTFIAATTGTVLTVVGYFLSAPGGLPWMAVTNRVLACAVIWATAFLVLQRKVSDGALWAARTEQVVGDSERKLRGLLEAAPDAIVIVDRQGVIQLANAQTTAFFGYRAEELLGHPVEMLVPERFRQGHVVERRRYLDDLRVRPMGAGLELWARRKDKSEFPVEISLSPFETEDGVLVTAAIRDVTDRRRVEQELRAANATKSRFLAAASHDLRQPLQAATMYLHVLATELGDEGRPATIDKLRRSLNALRDLFNKLLDISKLDAGRITADKTEIWLPLLFEQLADEARPLAEAKGLDLRIVTAQVKVHSDPQLLAQILQNFLSNAVRYTERGRVLLGCRRAGTQLRIQVWDTGLGIESHEVEKVFEEFYQAGDRLRDREQGLGLGLAIVRRLSQLLDHPVAVRSEPGKGTMFEVTVPLASSQAHALEARERRRDLTSRGKCIAVIDDDPEVLDALRSTLEVADYQVVAASGTEDLLAQLRGLDFPPDAMVADYRLQHGATGIEAVEEVRKAFGSPVPSLLLTGDSSLSKLQEQAKKGGYQVLAKPVLAQELLKVLENLMEGTPRH